MDRSMEWFIGGVLVLIVGIVSYIMTKQVKTLFLPVLLFLFGIYKLVSAKK